MHIHFLYFHIYVQANYIFLNLSLLNSINQLTNLVQLKEKWNIFNFLYNLSQKVQHI